MRRVQADKPITRDLVPGSDHEDPSEQHSLDGVLHNPYVARLHVGIAVVHHDAVVAESVLLRGSPVDAGIAAHLAIVETVEVDTFSVHFEKTIPGINRIIDISG